MPEQQSAASTSNTDGQQTGAATSGAGDEQKQITLTPAQLADRLARAKPADYDELKAKAAKWDQAEAASKSEVERAAAAQQKAEQERDAARADALRLRVASRHGISDEDADLFLTGTDEATLIRQAERLAQRADDRKKQGNHVPGEGTNQTGGSNDIRDFAKQLFTPTA